VSEPTAVDVVAEVPAQVATADVVVEAPAEVVAEVATAEVVVEAEAATEDKPAN
jgi:hypothetical protein